MQFGKVQIFQQLYQTNTNTHQSFVSLSEKEELLTRTNKPSLKIHFAYYTKKAFSEVFHNIHERLFCLILTHQLKMLLVVPDSSKRGIADT